ncbi:hypothetical protein [Pseudothioclava nitratireducens]|uniref:hypothetical protein n=1 Tax=Pseudothioclava nitratireducens TaxID=1928646 RepID=UPI0023DA3378|nr:hypothetical protein [Defluviimonas nitratireducens]MDF1620183.1 hypothetical protein [Defluviimonas nitratireducens]
MTRAAFETLIEAGPIRVLFAPGTGSDLVISFSSIGRRRAEMPPPELVGSAIGAAGRPALFVSDISRSWGNAPEFPEALQAAMAEIHKRQPVECVTAIGFSMGAFCALAAGRILDLHAIVAISAQYSILRRHIGPETRWRYWTKRVPRPLAFPVAPLPRAGQGPQVTLLHGLRDDLAHARAFATPAGVDHFLFPAQSHSDLGQHLKASGQLGPLIEAAITRDRRALSRAMRRAGGDFRARILPPDASLASTEGTYSQP